MRHIGIVAVLEDRERMARELAARPRPDRADPDTRRSLRRWLAALIGPRPVPTADPADLTIRQASTADAGQLAQLAQLTERRVPRGPVLVAQIETELIAALPLAGGPVLTDVRRATADVVQLLELRSQQLRRADRAA